MVFHAPSAARKRIHLSFHGEDHIPPVAADESRITEVFDNLVSNAIKYTPVGGGVTIRCEAGTGEVITHVQDNGQGLTEDDLKNAFRTFRKLSARPTGGELSTGLGLAIVKRLVEIHGGRVWVVSRKEQGSTFSFAIPCMEGFDRETSKGQMPY